MFKASVKEISKEEEDAALAEARRLTAEGQFVALLEEIKRVKNLMSSFEDKINSQKEVIEENNKVIHLVNVKLLEVKNALKVENDNFRGVLKVNESVLSELNDDIFLKRKEREILISKIDGLNLHYENNKILKVKDVKELESKRESIFNEIKKLEEKRDLSLLEINKLQATLDNKKSEILKLDGVVSSLELSVSSLKIEIISKDDVIKNNVKIIEEKKKSIKELDEEIIDLKVKIEKKEEEYRTLETNAFAILHRQDALNQKEAFIKSQYERAGIKWEN